jgi:potassium/chloride transporter 9
LSMFGRGTKVGDEPIYAIFLTYAIAQVALFADLNQIATLISMGYQVSARARDIYPLCISPY